MGGGGGGGGGDKNDLMIFDESTLGESTLVTENSYSCNLVSMSSRTRVVTCQSSSAGV